MAAAAAATLQSATNGLPGLTPAYDGIKIGSLSMPHDHDALSRAIISGDR